VDILLRAATEADHPFLWTLAREANRDVVTRQFGGWDDVWQRRRFESKLPGSAYRIVSWEPTSVGAIWSVEHDDHFFIQQLLVLPVFQNRGIGSQLLRGECAAARAVGKGVRLHTLKMNRAVTFYLRHGFVVTGRDDTFIDMQLA